MLTLAVLLLVIALNVVVVVVIPKGFFPQQDTGVIFGGVQGPQDASFPVMDDSVQRLVGVIKTIPEWTMSSPSPAAREAPTADSSSWP